MRNKKIAQKKEPKKDLTKTFSHAIILSIPY